MHNLRHFFLKAYSCLKGKIYTVLIWLSSEKNEWNLGIFFPAAYINLLRLGRKRSEGICTHRWKCTRGIFLQQPILVKRLEHLYFSWTEQGVEADDIKNRLMTLALSTKDFCSCVPFLLFWCLGLEHGLHF